MSGTMSMLLREFRKEVETAGRGARALEKLGVHRDPVGMPAYGPLSALTVTGVSDRRAGAMLWPVWPAWAVWAV